MRVLLSSKTSLQNFHPQSFFLALQIAPSYMPKPSKPLFIRVIFQFKWSGSQHGSKKALSITVGELPNCWMGWRRTVNTNREAVDLFLKLTLAQKGILYVESDNQLVIHCFEQHFVSIEQLNISAREQQWQAGLQRRGKPGAEHDSHAARGSGLSDEAYSPTISKQGEKGMFHERNQRQSRVQIVVQVCGDEAHLNSSQEVKTLSQDQVLGRQPTSDRVW